MKDARKVLGVRPGETLKAAYLRRSKVLHPDAGGDPEEFARMKAAYEYLVSCVGKPTPMQWNIPAPTGGWKESKFQSELVKTLEGLGCRVFNCHGHSMQEAGWPDLWIGHPKFQGWFELKVNASLQKNQRVLLGRLYDLKCPAFVGTWKDGKVKIWHPSVKEVEYATLGEVLGKLCLYRDLLFG